MNNGARHLLNINHCIRTMVTISTFVSLVLGKLYFVRYTILMKRPPQYVRVLWQCRSVFVVCALYWNYMLPDAKLKTNVLFKLNQEENVQLTGHVKTTDCMVQKCVLRK